MAYSLKSTGLATDLISCVVVQEGGGSVVDLCGNGITVHANVIRGTDTWKGTTRGYFETLANGSFNFYGIDWNATRPAIPIGPGSSGASFFVAYAGAPATSSVPIDVGIGDGSAGLMRKNLSGSGNAGAGAFVVSGNYTSTGTTTIPTNGTTKFSYGTYYQYDIKGQMFYGPESVTGNDGLGTLAADSAVIDPLNVGGDTTTLMAIGGMNGQGNAPGKRFIVAVFDRCLLESEFQTLHNDWFGALIDSGVAAPSFTDHPDPIAVTAPATATFTVAATGATSYQWQLDTGGGFANVSSGTGQTATSYTTGATNIGMNGHDFRCMATGPGGITYSSPAELTVNAAAVVKGVRETFTVTPSGASTGVTVMWWDASPPVGNPVMSTVLESWDGSGAFEWTLTSTSLAVGGTGHLMIFKSGATKYDDVGFSGRVVVKDISS